MLHIIGGLNRKNGGPARSVQGLVSGEFKAGVDAWLWPIVGGSPWVDGVRCVSFRSLDDAFSTFGQYDLVHIHGIWNWRLHKACVACRRRGVPYIIALRGMLEPWSLKQKWLKKRIARWLYQDKDIRLAAAIHVTAQSEGDQLRRLGFDNMVIVSPNAVNLPRKFLRPSHVGARRMLFVSRMHKKKGVKELVEAWRRVSPKGWLCELVYTVNSDEERVYEDEVKRLVCEHGLADQFVFTGVLDDEGKWDAYFRANLFVLPTYSENFGIVVAEALWAGVPVITTKGAPWEELESEKCGWWIDFPLEDSLCRTLAEATELPSDKLVQMGANGHKLVERKYAWHSVTRAMIAGYEKVCVKVGRCD